MRGREEQEDTRQQREVRQALRAALAKRVRGQWESGERSVKAIAQALGARRNVVSEILAESGLYNPKRKRAV